MTPGPVLNGSAMTSSATNGSAITSGGLANGSAR